MYDENVIAGLNDILNNNNLLTLLPIENDNKIVIKHCVIEKISNNFQIQDIKLRKKICSTATKSAAVAFAKIYTQSLTDQKSLKEIKDLDYIIEKNAIDCKFYKNTITMTKNKILKQSVETRLHLAKSDINSAKKELYKIIFDVDKYF